MEIKAASLEDDFKYLTAPLTRETRFMDWKNVSRFDGFVCFPSRLALLTARRTFYSKSCRKENFS
jgi:hypothetical protein